MKTFIAVILELNTGLFFKSLDSHNFAGMKLNFQNLLLMENFILTFWRYVDLQLESLLWKY